MKKIFKRAGKSTEVVGISTEEYNAPAYRPAYSILENYMLKLTTDFKFKDWEEAFEEYIKTLL